MLADILLGESVAPHREGQRQPIGQIFQVTREGLGASWSEIPTCKSQGIDVEYLMLRGVFTTPGAAPDQVAHYIDDSRRCATPECKALMVEGAFNQTFMTGADFAKWLSGEEARASSADAGSRLPRR